MPPKATQDINTYMDIARPYLGRLALAFCCLSHVREMLVEKVMQEGLDWLQQGGGPTMLKQQLFLIMHGHVLGFATSAAWNSDPDDPVRSASHVKKKGPA